MDYNEWETIQKIAADVKRLADAVCEIRDALKPQMYIEAGILSSKTREEKP